MFKDNKYTKWYFNIIENAKTKLRTKGEVYYESHHIIPRALDGNNKKENLVLLTPKEHFICHLLLIKMCIDGKHIKSMYWAFRMMGTCLSKGIFTSNMYNFYREKFDYNNRGKNHPRYGLNWSNDYKRIISIKTKEAMNRPELKLHLSKVRTNKKAKESTKLLMSKQRKGKLWISNITLQNTKMIYKNELEHYNNIGWVKGRLFS